MKKATLSYALFAAGMLVLSSFTLLRNDAVAACKYTFLRTHDFRMKTVEVSNVFRIGPSYTPPVSYQYSAYVDSAEAERARLSTIHNARNKEYQVQLIRQNNQCSQ